METIDILTLIGGIGISIIGYFLKTTMSDLKAVKNVAYDSKTKIEVLESDYMNKIERLNEKFDLLYGAIEKLTDKLETLQSKI